MKRCKIKALMLGFLVGHLMTGVAFAQKVVPPSNPALQYSFAPVVDQAGPAVVNVYASRVVKRRQGSPFFNDPLFRRFFGEDDRRRGRQRQQSSLGSGVIISSAGMVVTNHHVIKGADEIRVVLADKREYDCDILLNDERTDLAILQIRDGRTRFPFVEFSDSDQLEVGDIVLAIGNPFGVGQTVTQGIVSALARTKVGVSDYQFFIQTDAAINPGNSGGALIDMNGQLAGINTAIYSRSGGSNGIGFAIPSNMVRTVVNSAAGGSQKVLRPWLGVNLQPVDRDTAYSLGLTRPRGALINGVKRRGPAERAGLKIGDVITKLDGIIIEDPAALNYHLATKGANGRINVQVLRQGRKRNFTVELEPRPERRLDGYAIKGDNPLSGARVSELNNEAAGELRLPRNTEGVVIIKIKRGSAAHRYNFRPGDIIQAVNGRSVNSVDALGNILRDDRFLWRFVVNRDGRTIRMAFGG